jgi:hypothetical protein
MAIFMFFRGRGWQTVKMQRVWKEMEIPYYKTREFPLQICCKSLSIDIPACTIGALFLAFSANPSARTLFHYSGFAVTQDRVDKTAVPASRNAGQAKS